MGLGNTIIDGLKSAAETTLVAASVTAYVAVTAPVLVVGGIIEIGDRILDGIGNGIERVGKWFEGWKALENSAPDTIDPDAVKGSIVIISDKPVQEEPEEQDQETGQSMHPGFEDDENSVKSNSSDFVMEDDSSHADEDIPDIGMMLSYVQDETNHIHEENTQEAIDVDISDVLHEDDELTEVIAEFVDETSENVDVLPEQQNAEEVRAVADALSPVVALDVAVAHTDIEVEVLI